MSYCLNTGLITGKVFFRTKHTHTHTHTTVLLLVWNMSGSTRVSRYQKGKTKKVKTNLDLLDKKFQEFQDIFRKNNTH